MTLIVGWRDPFCLVSDDAATGLFGDKTSAGAKIEVLSATLALGLAGPVATCAEIVKRVRGKLPATDWDRFEMGTREVVDELNQDKPCRLLTSVVVAGTIGDDEGIFDSVGRLGEPLSRQFAFAGSGGPFAGAARAIASMWRSEVAGLELLTAIVEAAVAADANSMKPLWRIDLGGPNVAEPYKWLL